MIPAALLSPKVIGPIVIGVAVFGAGWMARGQIAAGTIAKLEASHSQAVANAEKKAREAIESARQRELDLAKQTQEIAADARQTLQTLERAIADSRGASVGLQDAARRAISRCATSQNPTAAIGGSSPVMPSGRDDGERLMRLVTELDGFAGAAAADADRSRIARSACEAAYNAAMKAVNK